MANKILFAITVCCVTITADLLYHSFCSKPKPIPIKYEKRVVELNEVGSDKYIWVMEFMFDNFDDCARFNTILEDANDFGRNAQGHGQVGCVEDANAGS